MKTIEAKPATFVNRTGTNLLVGASDDVQGYELNITDLEDPVAVKFVNAWRGRKSPTSCRSSACSGHEPM